MLTTMVVRPSLEQDSKMDESWYMSKEYALASHPDGHIIDSSKGLTYIDDLGSWKSAVYGEESSTGKYFFFQCVKPS